MNKTGDWLMAGVSGCSTMPVGHVTSLQTRRWMSSSWTLCRWVALTWWMGTRFMSTLRPQSRPVSPGNWPRPGRFGRDEIGLSGPWWDNCHETGLNWPWLESALRWGLTLAKHLKQDKADSGRALVARQNWHWPDDCSKAGLTLTRWL